MPAQPASQPGPRGYDAARKINGRKRHVLADTCGFLLALKGFRRLGIRFNHHKWAGDSTLIVLPRHLLDEPVEGLGAAVKAAPSWEASKSSTLLTDHLLMNGLASSIAALGAGGFLSSQANNSASLCPV
ncbi:MAG: hypothetical protein JWM59_2238 [Verrucomicrobiales bacterium]|nr:hypothetical protein [Verrucomicrobiales bacterium]